MRERVPMRWVLVVIAAVAASCQDRSEKREWIPPEVMVGGNVDPQTDHVNAATNEWFHACSNGGERAWPYGDAYEAGVCHDVAVDGLLRCAKAASPASST